MKMKIDKNKIYSMQGMDALFLNENDLELPGFKKKRGIENLAQIIEIDKKVMVISIIAIEKSSVKIKDNEINAENYSNVFALLPEFYDGSRNSNFYKVEERYKKLKEKSYLGK